ncbi:hypothetical protein EJ05DRAFT_491923 [Pseudovirgaria hyperparasitica]|uniref:Heterokaryon incompatibility domain-containing protein n=1 Tax=Pseudovirgaria hyperparasitica TaxID=470096 RepID=A0A6A6WIX7_9PEZI|nr:uncharacterized protein EJ05DRAFT_491923 [Pseudovirgaria hyperparasitica]KAF2761201.1 hypothetical protein EJ05DRAFT_491923 [Pseudovirgaria hyperparasitica]
MMESFIYEPLDSEQHDFRLLTLLGGDEKQIRCRISHYSLSSDSAISKPYEALSYAWGVTAFVECIEVNDKEFWITENLKTALDVLRHRDKGNDRTLWIDAICVNQEDLKECNQQVPMMGEIFEKAEQVIFWLGKATKHARTLMRCLNTLESAFVDRSEGEHWEIDDTRWLGLWNSFGFAEEVKQACVTGLEFLLSQPWFERVWIIQEVARASVGTVCISDFNVSPKILAVAPVVLDTIPDPHCLSILSIMPGLARSSSRSSMLHSI